MAVKNELVLYYTPEKSDADRLLKGVLVRMGVRIRGIGPEQIFEQVGFLAGLPGFEPRTPDREDAPGAIPEKLLILHGFSQQRLTEMLQQFRRSKVPPIALKAILTDHNCQWSLFELYQELRAEHEKMNS